MGTPEARYVAFRGVVPHDADDTYLDQLRTQSKDSMTYLAAKEGRKLTGPVTVRTSQEVFRADGTLYAADDPRDTYVTFKCDTTPADD